ncbi:MAG: uracil-DNA glycosylase [Phycisphaeraceae bacterium]|nr:uracil-DNA glycosylase [Phycisphaeraceae bacterium]MBX3366621.1 uracil-DNA glycosylase [Phycisphaeraceae bacterium]
MSGRAPRSDADPALARVVAQHARTSSLLGVDFVPAYRSPVPASQDGGAMIEPKPMPVVGGSGAERQRRLDDLRARYERDAPHAPFISSYTNIVFGEGDPCARLMFIGEAPGEQEDLSGRPFVGRAGELLQRMIVAMGLERERVYIANVLKVRPPNNATPTLEETRASAPYLFEQIDIVAPEVIVTLGLPATRTILETEESMGRLRGLWSAFRTPSGLEVPVMPTYHPAYLLRAYTTENRAKVWSDLLKVVERLGLTPRRGEGQ